MIEEIRSWADDNVIVLWCTAGAIFLLAAREWLLVSRRSWALRLNGGDRVDSASGAQSYAAGATVILPSDIDVAQATGRQVCLLLIRVEDGDPVDAAQYLKQRIRRYEHLVRIEYQLLGCLLLVKSRSEAVLAAGRLLDGVDLDGVPFRIVEAGFASVPEDGHELIDLVDRAATRFIPVPRIRTVAEMAARVPTIA